MKRINWRYAIGELLIVIVGISVAFALNNWSASIKQDVQKQDYLSALKADINHDAALLETLLTRLEQRDEFLKRKFIPTMFNAMPGSDSVVKRYYSVIDPVRFTPRDATLQSMKFSGDLKLIDNLALKNQILQHYETYGGINTELERHTDFAKQYLAKYFMQNIDFTKSQEQGGLQFLTDPYFRNLTFSLLGINQNQIKAYKEALTSANELLESLD